MRIKILGLLAASMLALSVPVAQAADGNPLEKTNGFYVDPDSNPAQWVRQNPGDKPRVDKIKAAIATKAGGRWFGNWSGDIRTAVDTFTYAADVVDKLPILVAYNIPGRDCGGHSGGGAGSVDAYKTWISNFAAGIGGKPAVVIIEPDALAQLDCLPQAERQTRLELLKFAAAQFAQKAPNTWAYMDGGNATWIPAATMADRLHAAGVSTIRGFAVNVSNFHSTQASNTYGNNVSAALSSKYGYPKPFVVDTSRNGNGSNGDWCNPPGRKLGTPSQVGGGADMLLWIKVPGDSDGTCGVIRTIPAGEFSPELAEFLIDGT
ncbi:endoglucanase [Kibdelosporangium banguiense]|uniref:Glucanase n=1 Tax=Kibdelosporangium banguiense TaxID=1365924 RepID=A0ABS4U0Z5_9PSEU|nr:glycoside hydrolase family 6 protein [Kibdelosporangium banguiense]MBP2330322.1 endoglucanase [Kibdelosporangium banguiense]